MLSIFDKGGFAPCPEPFNLAEHVLAAGQKTPDKNALSILSPDHSVDWTYEDLTKAIRGIGTGLLNAGLSAGDILLLRLGNTVDFPLAYLGAIAVGIVPVPTSSQLTSIEVQKIIDTLKPAAVVRADGVACPETHLPIVTCEDMGQWRTLPAAPFNRGSPERLAYIVYTSGTSGVSRAVGHAHRAIWARQMMMQGWYGLGPEDRLMHAGAFNWTYTLGTGLMDPWSMGATALIPAQGVTPDQVASLMHDHKVTIFAGAPGVYRNLLKTKGLDLPHLRHGLAAGEKLSETIRQDWLNATGAPIFEAYGMSECSTFISSSPKDPARNGALGQPQVGRKVAIVGPDGPVEINQPGVIAIHASDTGLMLGYIGAEDETKSKFQDDWFLTGDQGMMDETGQIHYLGRSDDMMNAGGYRVSPIEVEAALIKYPGIEEIGVTDVEIKPDVRLIAAFYTAQSPISEADLSAFAADQLARYKQPRFFVHVPSLPRNPNGKLLRKNLKPLFK